MRRASFHDAAMQRADFTFEAMEWPPGRGDASLPQGPAQSPVVHRTFQGLATGLPVTPGTVAWVSGDPLDSPRSQQVLLATPFPPGRQRA